MKGNSFASTLPVLHHISLSCVLFYWKTVPTFTPTHEQRMMNLDSQSALSCQLLVQISIHPLMSGHKSELLIIRFPSHFLLIHSPTLRPIVSPLLRPICPLQSYFQSLQEWCCIASSTQLKDRGFLERTQRKMLRLCWWEQERDKMTCSWGAERTKWTNGCVKWRDDMEIWIWRSR